MKKVFALILCVSLLLCGCSAAPQSIKDDNPVVPETVKSVWMAYFELEKYTSECADSNSFESEIKSAFKKVKSLGLNTITVQVRPCADAFYKSSYFPVSKYCFGVQGSELIYDPLAIMVKAAHNLGLRIEAWVNPYRVSQENDINALSSGNPAKKWLEDTEKSSCVYVADKIYFNPARSEVTELIVNGVKEIVKNYAVDGIHFDDYFYPTTNEEIDEKEYSQYQSSGGDMGLSDWRRNNVCEMIKAVYKAVKEENSSVMFGISPQSKVSTDYSTLYADVEKWASEPGYADYICPQIYFGFWIDICQHSVGISRSAGLERQYLTVRWKRGQAFPVCLDGTQFLQATTLTSVIGNDSPINRLPAKIVGNHDLLFITGKITIDRGQSGYANRIDRL